MSSALFIGIALGLLGAIPVAALWSRRTERRVRQLEARARAAERLAELGTMTSGLAHEIKNPLSTVGLNVQLLREDLDDLADQVTDQPRLQEALDRSRHRCDTLLRESQRLKDILADFLRFAGRMELDRNPTDINALVAEMVDFYEPQAAQHGIRLRTQLAANPATLPADAGLLKQALLNLLINATQAMTDAREHAKPHGGADELIIRTENRRALDRDELHLHVIDTGPGIDPKAADKLFQPYFSTKRGGSGLGLPTARRIVEEHGGHLTVHSAPGRGTDFTLALPFDVAHHPD